MGLFDNFKKALTQAESDIKKSGLDKSLKNQPSGNSNATAPHQGTSFVGARKSHPGYAKIAAWVKRKCGSKISGLTDPYQKNLELEQLSAEACSGLSAKAKKGFLDYLKSQNYEQLLK